MTATSSSTRAGLAALYITTCLALTVGGGSIASDALLSTAANADANAIQGGALDPKLDEVGPTNGQGSTTDESGVDVVRHTWEDPAHDTLGNDVVSNTLRIDNAASTILAPRIDVAVAFEENDSAADDGNAPNTSRTIEVTTFRYDGNDMTDAELADLNDNGYLDVEDLTLGSNSDNLTDLSGVESGAAADLAIELSGSADLIAGVGSGDGVDVTVTITAHEASYADADASKNNTIQYA